MPTFRIHARWLHKLSHSRIRQRTISLRCVPYGTVLTSCPQHNQHLTIDRNNQISAESGPQTQPPLPLLLQGPNMQKDLYSFDGCDHYSIAHRETKLRTC